MLFYYFFNFCNESRTTNGKLRLFELKERKTLYAEHTNEKKKRRRRRRRSNLRRILKMKLLNGNGRETK
jgi:hypothetical protein